MFIYMGLCLRQIDRICLSIFWDVPSMNLSKHFGRWGFWIWYREAFTNSLGQRLKLILLIAHILCHLIGQVCPELRTEHIGPGPCCHMIIDISKLLISRLGWANNELLNLLGIGCTMNLDLVLISLADDFRKWELHLIFICILFPLLIFFLFRGQYVVMTLFFLIFQRNRFNLHIWIIDNHLIHFILAPRRSRFLRLLLHITV